MRPIELIGVVVMTPVLVVAMIVNCLGEAVNKVGGSFCWWVFCFVGKK